MMMLALLLAVQAASPPGDPGIVSGSASAASRGGAGEVDPDPGYLAPAPTVVGGQTPSTPLPPKLREHGCAAAVPDRPGCAPPPAQPR